MMKFFLFFLCLIGPISADVAIMFDCAYQTYGLNLENYQPPAKANDPGFAEQPWFYQVHYALKCRGEKVFPTNLYDDELASISKKNVRAIIFCNIPWWRGSEWKKMVANLKCKKILLCWEPATVLPEMYKKESLELFDVVFTWNSDLVDNKRIFQFYYPVLQQMPSQITPFKEKKLLTQISCNKTSPHRHELYSLRKSVIDFFEKKETSDFVFYGRGWDGLGFRNYGGTVDDKRKTLDKFRFSTCFENMSHVNGYVTEKIFDCFGAGCVPVYYGASDITRYVPQNCFISWGQFKSVGKLYRYLKAMPEEEYQQYIKNIRAFLVSKQAQRFTNAQLAKAILKKCQVEKKTKKKHSHHHKRCHRSHKHKKSESRK
jgi:hypothetical protein